jgi:hypothetical protein
MEFTPKKLIKTYNNEWFTIKNNFNQNLHYRLYKKCIFTVNYLLLYVLTKFRCTLHEDGDNVET